MSVISSKLTSKADSQDGDIHGSGETEQELDVVLEDTSLGRNESGRQDHFIQTVKISQIFPATTDNVQRNYGGEERKRGEEMREGEEIEKERERERDYSLPILVFPEVDGAVDREPSSSDLRYQTHGTVTLHF